MTQKIFTTRFPKENQVKTIVGGAPLTEKFAKDIGADGYAPDAASAVDAVKALIT